MPRISHFIRSEIGRVLLWNSRDPFIIAGVLLYGPPGTGKTLLARACAAQTKSTFLKLAGPQLVQMFIGDGAKLVRDAFSLAKEKKPAIIFIDELDAIGECTSCREKFSLKMKTITMGANVG